jgi:hypothetical protein
MKEINRSETLPLTHAVFANLDIGVFFKESLNGVWHLKTSRSTAVCNFGTQLDKDLVAKQLADKTGVLEREVSAIAGVAGHYWRLLSVDKWDGRA